MRYYRFLWDPRNSVTATHPHDDEGRELWTIFDPRPWDADHGTSQVPQYAEESDILRGDQLPDYVHIGSLSLLVSLKAKMILVGLCLGGEIGFLPTRIVNRKGKHLADYFMLYSRTETPVVDTEKSDIEYVRGGCTFPPASVRSYVLCPEQLPDSDLFLSEIPNWMATERVKDQFEAHGVTGIFFKPIWSHEEGPVMDSWDSHPMPY